MNDSKKEEKREKVKSLAEKANEYKRIASMLYSRNQVNSTSTIVFNSNFKQLSNTYLNFSVIKIEISKSGNDPKPEQCST